WLAGEVLDRQLAYWKERLAGAPPAIALPTDRPRPPAPSHRGGVVPFSLGEAATRALRELARREGATLFMTLLAAFDVLLHRWSGQTDLSVGTPIAGRARAETEALAGFFVNTLVLRAELDPERPFLALLRQVREDALGAYAHQDAPFERLVQELSPERDLGTTPLFQVMFALQTAPSGAARLEGTRRRALRTDGGSAKFDLALALVDGPSGLSGAMEYATDLFDASTVERILASYRVLLEGLPAHSSRMLGELPILPPEAERRMVVDWNRTDVRCPDRCVHELFQAQVRETPLAVAVTCGDERVTYEELRARAGALARYL